MREILDAIMDVVGLVSPSKVSAVADEIRAAKDADSARGAIRELGTRGSRAAVERLIKAWSASGVSVSGPEVAGMLLGAAENRRQMEKELGIELVWTGPTTSFVPTRRTEQVLIELIQSASADLFLVSFVVYDVDTVVSAMNEASRRGVRLRVLVEASTSHGGTLDVDPAATMRKLVPDAEIYAWREKSEAFAGGKVHAKIAVVDGVRAFVTSANLTGHALEKNMEAGVLVRGGRLPKTLFAHLEALIDVGVVGRV